MLPSSSRHFGMVLRVRSALTTIKNGHTPVEPRTQMSHHVDHLKGVLSFTSITSFNFDFSHLRIGVGHRVLKNQMAIGDEFSRMFVSRGRLIQFVLHIVEADRRFDDSVIILEEPVEKVRTNSTSIPDIRFHRLDIAKDHSLVERGCHSRSLGIHRANLRSTGTRKAFFSPSIDHSGIDKPMTTRTRVTKSVPNVRLVGKSC